MPHGLNFTKKSSMKKLNKKVFKVHLQNIRNTSDYTHIKRIFSEIQAYWNFHLCFEIDLCGAPGILILWEYLETKLFISLVKGMWWKYRRLIVLLHVVSFWFFHILICFCTSKALKGVFGKNKNGKRYCCGVFKNRLQNLYFGIEISSFKYSTAFWNNSEI